MVTAFHGTGSLASATSILKQGWQIGHGASIGAGVYLSTTLSVAKAYAGSGCYVRCQVRLGRCLDWNVAAQARYQQWCQRQNITPDGSAISAFARKEGYDTIRQNNVIVVPAILCANPTAWRYRFRQIQILSIHQASDDRKIFVS